MHNHEWLLTLGGIFGPETGPIDHLIFWGSFLLALFLLVQIYKGLYRVMLSRDPSIPSAMLIANLVLLVLAMATFYGLWVLLIGQPSQDMTYILAAVGGICLILALVSWATRRARA